MIQDYFEIETIDLNENIYGHNAFEFFSKDRWVAVVGEENDFSMISHVGKSKLPKGCKYPIISFLDRAHVVLVNSRIERQGVVNAWVLSLYDGSVKQSFSVGDAVENIVVTKDYIVVSYFDEGVFGDIAPSDQGIGVFSKNGEYVLGYRSSILGAVEVADCYAMSHVDKNKIVFFPYTDFEIVILDIDKKEQQVFQTPVELHGAGKISFLDDNVYVLIGPYKERGHAFYFDVNKKEIKKFKIPDFRFSIGGAQGKFQIWSDRSIGCAQVIVQKEED